ncbi:uncharacterized protein JCM15063_003168 [Sporobolomyces koalae]|uniref:uncharacterized protein n=1 Tax=Sporobolomyces koalae TaxID=500713 RepID=UPI003178E2F6
MDSNVAYTPLPSSRPSTPRSGHRSFDRYHRPDSLALSPQSVYSYSETDAFLSPRTQPATPLSPGSPFTTFHPARSAHDSILLSPLHPEFPRASSGYFELKLPPTAKRAKKTGLWVGIAAGVAVVLGCLALVTAHSSGRIERKYKSWMADKSVMGQGTTEVTRFEPTDNGSVPILPTGENDGKAAMSSLAPIPISTRPKPQPNLTEDDVRYIGYLPHSGYHNQRVALQNALLLGKLLNRTVLIPPIWIGWPVATEPYDVLAQAWTDIILSNPESFSVSDLNASSPMNSPARYPSTSSCSSSSTCAAGDRLATPRRPAELTKLRESWIRLGYKLRPDGYPITNLTEADCKSYSAECRHTYRDTFLDYKSLVNLEEVEKQGVRIATRWDMREKAIEELVGAKPEEIFVLRDLRSYDFLFTDLHKTVDSPLISPRNPTDSRWKREISIPTLRGMSQKVLLVGSLFGAGRIQTQHPEASQLTESFAKAMAFRDPWLMRPADEIVPRLGGPRNYVGVHARVGDGGFKLHAQEYMEVAWKQLVARLGYDRAGVDAMWQRFKTKDEIPDPDAAGRKTKRHSELTPAFELKQTPFATSWNLVDEDYSALISVPPAFKSDSSLKKRSPDNDDAWAFLRGPSGEPSALLRNLHCRGPLHTDLDLKRLNVPLYLATDSPSPTEDPNLRPFFDAFPCAFVLSDFDHPFEPRNDDIVVESVQEMGRLVSELDGFKLGRLFLPFLEAIIASKGKETVGTPHSTFSAFAAGPLHDAYAESG